MKHFSFSVVFAAAAFEAIAQSPQIEVIGPLCENAALQMSCQTTCAPACSNAEFLSKNTTYCLSNNLIGGTVQPKADESICAGVFAKLVSQDNEAPSANPEDDGASGAGDDCDTLSRLSERRKCKLAKVTPKCSPTVRDLEGRAQLLVTEIGNELKQYGDLLQRDWTDVDNRDLLCQFSLDQLDENHQLASENPELLRVLERQANDIQVCQADWETWVRENAGTRSSDVLIDQVTRDAEEQLGPLKTEIEGLSKSVSQLDSAAQTIVEIVDVHILFCDPEGSSPLAAD